MFSETSVALLEGPAPEVVPSGSRSPPASGSLQYPPPGHPAHPQSNGLLVPALPPRSRAHSFGTPHEQKRKESQPPPQERPRSQYISPPVPQQQQQQQPYLPPSPLPSPPRAIAGPPGQHFSQPHSPPLPNPMFTPPLGGMSDPNAVPAPRPDLPRRCNFLVERNDSSVKGTWTVDTALIIPEALRPPISEFNGVWNEMDKKAIKQREKEKKKREGGGWGRKKVVDTTPPKPLLNEGVMPNVMLISKNGSVQGDVNVVSGDGAIRQAVVVAESLDGSVKLNVDASPEQPLRIFAISMDGSVRVKIPPTFEGAISLTALDGTVHISDGVKARLMTFSQTNKSVRCYLGDWQAANFGAVPPSPSQSPSGTSRPAIPTSPKIVPPPSFPPTSPQEAADPFKTWTGPLAHLLSRDGSVHLSFIGEDTSSMFSKAMQSIKNSFLGTGNEEREDGVDVVGGVRGVDSRAAAGGGGGMGAVVRGMESLPLPRGVAMQAYAPQAQQVLQHLASRYPTSRPGLGPGHGKSASGPAPGRPGPGINTGAGPSYGGGAGAGAMVVRGAPPRGREYATLPSEPSLFEHDPHASAYNPRGPPYDPRQLQHDPRQPQHDPRQAQYDPRQTQYDQHQTQYDSRQPQHPSPSQYQPPQPPQDSKWEPDHKTPY
ncbi:hypothetical protein BDV93DRAFT_251291 [Ceratobasidium sp. AG-I]|nr:hypothetical protein BDV93DRAFT_251291 [Ceratobasidium sp. AG-I]